MALLLDGFKASWMFVNENSLLIRFANATHAHNSLVAAEIVNILSQSFGHSLVETVPSYETVFVEFNPFLIEDPKVISKLNSCLYKINGLENKQLSALKTTSTIAQHEIPVLYDLKVAPDIKRYNDKGISLEELIELHTSEVFHVFAVGFSPGFAFMGNVSKRLQLPRHTHPRENVLAGSVAIAENQTAIYSQNTPGGWNIIGHSPISIYDPNKNNYGLFKAGDSVTYISVTRQEYLELGGDLDQFNY